MRRAILLGLVSLLIICSGCVLLADVSSIRAHELVAAGALLVDVRTPEEWSEGHVEGAVNVPMGHLERRVPELAKRDRPIVLYCRSGSRSWRAQGTLQDIGFTQVYNLGPMSAW